MKRFYIIIFISTTFFACSLKTESPVSLQHKLPLTGTWKLISGTIIENGKTTVTDYTTILSFIKIINDWQLKSGFQLSTSLSAQDFFQ